MITQLKIENYKSIQDLTLDVGRVNVLIGENGCGKSNILEAITLAGAAEANKLDNEFLVNRGIRVTEPQLMRSAFNNLYNNQEIKIELRFESSDENQSYILCHDNKHYSSWVIKEILDIKRNFYSISDLKNRVENLRSKSYSGELEEIYRKVVTFINSVQVDRIGNFIIYSPENTALRNFSQEPKIEPLGDKGEGLLTLLIHTQHEARQSQDFNELNDIKETLELFGWYEAIEIPDDFSLLEKKITIKDRYLEMPFDQRSANEGFLLVLFYITLVVSKYTPKIFAIDNIDTSLNPKLCTKLITELTRLAKKYDKQIFLTSHNPAILDGIDLADDEQRLFVIYRDDEGRTCCDRIDLKDKPKSSARDRIARLITDNEPHTKEEILNRFDNSPEPLKLSEAFLRGYLGGLPTGF